MKTNLYMIVRELKKEEDKLIARIGSLRQAIHLLGEKSPVNGRRHRHHRHISAEGRRRISEAMKLRWAKLHAQRKRK